jgi:hypothetical protein
VRIRLGRLIDVTRKIRENKDDQHHRQNGHDHRKDEVSRMDIKTELVSGGKPQNGDNAYQAQQDAAPMGEKSSRQ